MQLTGLHHLTAITADAPGNNRLDSLANVAQVGRVGMLVLVPGIDEVHARDHAGEAGADADFPHYLVGRQTPASAVRMGDWKLLETFETGEIELYELSSDIGEGENLAAIRPEKAAAMHSRLKAWRASIGAKIPLKNPNWPD